MPGTPDPTIGRLPAGPLHAFLRGDGRDGRGRFVAEVLALDDARLEALHDYVQWLFPGAEPSRAVPGSPVLGPAEAAAIRDDPRARDNLRAGLARMRQFYARTDAWLAPHDHNHLRITRIIAAARALLGPDEAAGFHAAIRARAAGHPVNPDSLGHWDRALRG